MALSRPQSQVPRRIERVRGGSSFADDDLVAAEEPLEIRLIWQEAGTIIRKRIAVTMRTPGSDFELAAGFLYGEGVVRGAQDVVDIAYCPDESGPQNFNIVQVTLAPGLDFDAGRLERNFYTTSSCGVCGKASLEALEIQGCEVLPPGLTVSRDVILSLPETLRAAQAVFAQTGGLHASGRFDTEGRLLSLREDVGRHNAFDKLVGEQLLAGNLPLSQNLVLLSGRASFELVQKALMARVPVVAAVGAPSSLAVELAENFGMTLVGFLRREGFNIYSAPERIVV
jgi:FdhD protein